jgi:hypothetical protein
MLERMYIKDIQEKLPFKDRRTLKKWCRNMGICIFSDPGSNRLYILKMEFEMAINNKEKLEYLKGKYGEEKALEIIKNCSNSTVSTVDSKYQSNYIPFGEHEKNFLKSLQSI